MDSPDCELVTIQHKLSDIWREVLNQKEIPLDASFLSLGGDSLSAILCISRIEKSFGVELAIHEFFADDSTVRSLSKIIIPETSEI